MKNSNYVYDTIAYAVIVLWLARILILIAALIEFFNLNTFLEEKSMWYKRKEVIRARGNK